MAGAQEELTAFGIGANSKRGQSRAKRAEEWFDSDRDATVHARVATRIRRRRRETSTEEGEEKQWSRERPRPTQGEGTSRITTREIRGHRRGGGCPPSQGGWSSSRSEVMRLLPAGQSHTYTKRGGRLAYRIGRRQRHTRSPKRVGVGWRCVLGCGVLWEPISGRRSRNPERRKLVFSCCCCMTT